MGYFHATDVGGSAKNAAVVYQLAKRYAPVFGAPLDMLLTVTEIESSHDPKKVNMRRADKGGAWGLGQQMADEADYKVKLIGKHYGRHFPWILPVLRRWKGQPQNLLDPELNMLLTAWQIGRLRRVFGNFPTMIAAYHQGEGAVQRRLEAGQPPVSVKQPLGMAYVDKAEKVREKYAPLATLQLALAD